MRSISSKVLEESRKCSARTQVYLSKTKLGSLQASISGLYSYRVHRGNDVIVAQYDIIMM